jgi:hypothetical protein
MGSTQTLQEPDATARAASTARVAARSDVVRDGGRFALAGPGVTRAGAMADDLRRVRSALDRLAIGYLLVRGDDDRPVIAVDRTARRDLERVFAEEFADEPFYARVDDGVTTSERLLALGRLPGDDAELFLLYRRRMREMRAGWRIAEAAIRLELWSFGETDILAPRANALTRRRIPRVEAVQATVARDGEEWPTLAGMFDDHADDVDFDIDLVFSWANGSDPVYLAERQRLRGVGEASRSDSDPARYRQIDELRYALRSVHAFAPWIRRIFVATDSPAPEWLEREHPRVTFVRSEEFFADPTVLPTFNSHAVESQLHRIPGLAEHFLYSNDDMFFGRPVTPAMFFSPGGVSRFVEATVRIGLGESNLLRTGHDNAMRVNRALLKERFGRTITRHLEHCPTPMRRSVLGELEREFPADFARTGASRFRSGDDISVTNSLYHYYALLTGRAVAQTALSVLYVETTLAVSATLLRRLERRRSHEMFCLNDGSEPEIDEEVRVATVTSFLERYFPVPGPWELPGG